MARQVSIAKALLRRSSDGAYLMLRRSAWDDRPELAHQPDIPGGTVELGESLLDGCQREVSEEVGLDIARDNLRLIYTETKYIAEDDLSVSRALYFAKVDDDNVQLSWEHEDYSWLAFDQLMDYGLRSHWQNAIDYGHQHGLLD